MTEETAFEESVWVECPACKGDGFLAICIDGYCAQAEEGCDFCREPCETCKGDGGWYVPPDDPGTPRIPKLVQD